MTKEEETLLDDVLSSRVDSMEKGATLLETYRIESDAIEGGMGKVWRVRHTGWNVDLALKQPKQELFQNNHQKENFIHECEAWINLGLHPHIVSCYYVREIGGVPSIFSEWMEGGSLKSWIYPRADKGLANGGQIEGSGRLYEGDAQTVLTRVLDVAIQFAYGLRYAHEQGLIHQDVKPDNLLLTQGGEAKVADFGIARARAALNIENADVPDGGTIVSDAGGYTPAYCSPEQMNGIELTRRTDIYSWAASVLEMFLGERKWEIGSIVGTVCEDYFAMDMRVDMPECMKELLQKCLAEEPDERPHSFAEIDIALLKIYHAATGSDYPREISKAAADTADSLNNRALSFLDLGKLEEAGLCWEEALTIMPNHVESLYNRGIYRWEHGMADDIEIIDELTKNRTSNTDYFLAKIHLSRGDAESAGHCLDEAEKISDDTGDIKKIRSGIQEMIENGEDGKCLHTYKYDGNIWSVCFSPDGKTLVSGNGERVFKLWDVETWKIIRTFSGHEDGVGALCFSPDGQSLISGSYDSTLKLWDVETGQCIHTFEGHKRVVASVCFNPDGRTVISGSWDKTLKLWDVETGLCVRTFEGHEGSVVSVFFNPDGKNVVSGVNRNEPIKIWDTATGQCISNIGQQESVSSVCYSPDGKTVLSGVDDVIKIWDVASGQCIRTFAGHKDSIKSVGFSPDGTTIISGSRDKSVKLWDVAAGKCTRTFALHKKIVNTVSFHADGKKVISASEDGTFILWGLPVKKSCEMALCRIKETSMVLQNKDLFNSLAAKADSLIKNGDISAALDLLAEMAGISQFGESAEYLTLKNSAARYCVLNDMVGYSTKFIRNAGAPVCFSHDGKAAIFSANNKMLHFNNYEITMWDIDAERCIRTFEGHKEPVTALCFSPDDSLVVSGSRDRTIKMWNTITGEYIRTFERHKSGVSSLNFSPDGKIIISRDSTGGLAVLWDAFTGHCIHRCEINAVCDLAYFSPDGRTVVMGYRAAGFKFWDVNAGKYVDTLEEHHKNTIRTLCFSSDYKTLLSAGWDTPFEHWHGMERINDGFFKVENWPVQPVNPNYFSPDGKLMIYRIYNNLTIWDIVSRQCVCAFEGFVNELDSFCFSPDGMRIAAATNNDVYIYNLDYNLSFPGWQDWDDGALPYVQDFLALRPDYNGSDFDNLIIGLQCRGFGWLRPEGIQYKLDELQFGG